MTKTRIRLTFLTILAMTGCTLPDAPEYGQKCPPPDYQGTMQCVRKPGVGLDECVASQDGEYTAEFTANFCPLEYPSCVQDPRKADGLSYFCMKQCGEGMISCYGDCIDPMTSDKYCGAGYGSLNPSQCLWFDTCTDNKRCVDGVCKEVPINECEPDTVHCGKSQVDEDFGVSRALEIASKCELKGDHYVMAIQSVCATTDHCNPETGVCEVSTCQEGEFACQNVDGDDGMSSSLLQCQNGRWVELEKCDKFCDSVNGKCIAPKCTEIKQICVNVFNSSELEGATARGEVYHCVSDSGDDRIESEPCMNDFSCCEGSECDGLLCGDCVNGAQECRDVDGVGEYRVCRRGRWSEPTRCMGNVACEGNHCAPCEVGALSCINASFPDNLGGSMTKGYVQVCDENHNWIAQENCEFLCAEDGKSCASCREGATSCEMGSDGIGLMQTCQNGDWTEAVPCANGARCANRRKCLECADDAVRCVDHVEVGNVAVGYTNTCILGLWGSDVVCPNKVSCTIESTCGECTNGDKKCADGYSYECIHGVWANKTQCYGGASCLDAERCGGCKEDSIKCENDNKDQNNPYKGYTSECKDGSWTNKTSCPGKFSCQSEQTCGECNNGTKKCENGFTYTCVNGSWDEDSKVQCAHEYSCTSPLNNSFGSSALAQCGECQNDSIKCERGYTYKCVSGVWKERTECPGAVSCKNDTECGDCKNDDVKCVVDASYTCSGGVWPEEGTPCDGGVSCQNEHTCGGCADGETKCEGGYKTLCQGGRWVDRAQCEGAASCKDNQQCGDCANDDVKCEDGKTYSCSNGVWETNGVECPQSASCMNSVSCGICKNGESYCENGHTYTCENGQWGAPVICENGAFCKNKNECGECADGDIKCEGNTRSTCSQGMWQPETCPSGFSCKNAVECGECVNNSTKCEDAELAIHGILSTCKDGRWSQSACQTTCKDGVSCN